MRLKGCTHKALLWICAALMLPMTPIAAHGDQNNRNTPPPGINDQVKLTQLLIGQNQLIDKSRACWALLDEALNEGPKIPTTPPSEALQAWASELTLGSAALALFTTLVSLLSLHLTEARDVRLATNLRGQNNITPVQLADVLQQIRRANTRQIFLAFQQAGVDLPQDMQKAAQQNPSGTDHDLLILAMFSYAFHINFTSTTREAMKEYFPPQYLLWLGVQMLADSGQPVYTPEFGYSDGPSGFELAAQTFISALHGIGVEGGYDLGRYSRRFARSLIRLAHALNEPTTNPNFAQVLFNQAAQAYVDTTLGWNIAAIYRYHALSNTGTLHENEAGISLYKAFAPPSWHGNNGISVQLSVQNAWSDLEGQPFRSAVRTAATIAWQDEISYFDKTKQAVLRRWNYKLGFEYRFWNVVDQENDWDLFVRFRVKRFNEISFFYGRILDKTEFAGVGVHFSVGW